MKREFNAKLISKNVIQYVLEIYFQNTIIHSFNVDE